MFWTVSVGIFYLGGELLLLIGAMVKSSQICLVINCYYVTFCDMSIWMLHVIILLSAETYEEKYRQH